MAEKIFRLGNINSSLWGGMITFQINPNWITLQNVVILGNFIYICMWSYGASLVIDVHINNEKNHVPVWLILPSTWKVIVSLAAKQYWKDIGKSLTNIGEILAIHSVVYILPL